MINFARAMVQIGKAKEGQSVLVEVASRSDSSSYIEANLLLGKLYMQSKELYDLNRAEVSQLPLLAHA